MVKRAGLKPKPTGTPLRFDVATLRQHAGNKAFERGVEYHADGQVEIISIDGDRVLADVSGSEVYRALLERSGKAFDGECSCPAFSDWGFCKHLVATALTINDLEPGAVEQSEDRLSRIRNHLRAKGIEPLVEMIMTIAERDPVLRGDLELAATAATADDESLFRQFKKAITEATRTHGYVEYRQAAAWADKILRVLDRIENLIEAGRAKLVLRLIDYFFARMDDAFESVDDSDGDGGAVYARGCEIHLAACRAAKPEPVALARELFAREVNSDWHFFRGASEAYADTLGDAGQREYRRLASEAWQKLKPLRPGGRQTRDDESSNRYQLSAILEGFAERDGDIDARIAIRANDLSSAYRYLGIAQLCLEHGREADALKWTEEGLWQFEDQPDHRLALFASDLYRRLGRAQDAQELLWRMFEQSPSMEQYKRLKGAAGKKSAAGVVDRAIAQLKSQLGRSGDGPGPSWSSPRELLLEILMSEERLTEAWEITHQHGCSESRLMELAKASEQSHPREALSAYARGAEQLVRLGGQDAYKKASKIIAHMRQISDRIGAKADHTAFLAEFIGRHKAKRNLMKLLQPSRS